MAEESPWRDNISASAPPMGLWAKRRNHRDLSPPVQFSMVLEETQNMPAGKDSFQPPVGENRQLVDILSAHNLKRLDCGSVGRNCPELT
jgi:hypothetical protein